MKNKLFFVLGIIFVLIVSSSFSVADYLTIGGEKRQDASSFIKSDEFSTQCTSAKWTVMVYVACDSARDSLTDDFLQRLTNIGSRSNVNIIALVDGLSDMDTVRYFIHKNLLEPLPWYEPESDMSDPLTFQRFISLTKYQYPADHYALFTLSAWGSGWQGVFSDTHGTGSSKTLSVITMPEVDEVLKDVTDNGTNKIDVWGIDVCIPGMLEVAYEIAPYVKYMVANEEHGLEGDIAEEGYDLGWNYSFFIQKLVDNPNISPKDFSVLIVDSYKAGTYVGKLLFKFTAPKWYPITKYYSTLSAIDLSRIDLIKTSINNFASNLTDNLDTIRSEIKNTRSETREYGKLYRKFWFLPITVIYLQLEPLGYDGFIDLYDFVEKINNQTNNPDLKNASISLMDALNETIIANEALPADHSYGLGIYFPKFRCQYDQSLWRGGGNPDFNKIPSSYDDLKFSKDTLWDEFLVTYLKIRK